MRDWTLGITTREKIVLAHAYMKLSLARITDEELLEVIAEAVPDLPDGVAKTVVETFRTDLDRLIVELLTEVS